MAILLDNIVKTAIVVTKDPENGIDGSGSNTEENRSDAEKDDDDDDDDGGTVVAKRGDGANDVSGGIIDGVLDRDNNGAISYMNKKELYEVYRDGIRRWNGEKLEDGNHGFREGDLVWGKVRSRPWWPGQIYDPRHASEFALKHSQEGCLLVAFFGDGSCSWCLPSQVVHFIENFNQISSKEEDKLSPKRFLSAVQKAVDEVGRVVESRLTCKCIRKKDHLARPLAANAGVKAGVFVPEVDVDRFCVPEYEPDEILTKVVNLAKGVSVGNTFELGILRSSLSAFYNARCGHPLPVYNKDNETALTTDLSPSIEVTTQGPVDDGMNKDEPKRMTKSVSGSSPKRLKTSGGEMEDCSSNGPSSTRKTRSQTRSVQEERPKTSGSDEGKVEIEDATSTRERKKSKYLMKPESDKIVHVTFDDEMPDVKEVPGQKKQVGVSRKMKGLVIDNGKQLSFTKSDIDIPVNELMTEIERTAVDPFFSSSKVWGFVSAFRGAKFVKGSDNIAYQKSIGNECVELISDVSPIKVKLDIIIAMLECCPKIPGDEKQRLKKEMKSLMQCVETASKPHRI